MARSARQLSGSERAAVLLMSLGEADAAAVLKLMDPREVEKVGTAMAALHGVSGEQVSEVMDRFAHAVDSQSPLHVEPTGGSRWHTMPRCRPSPTSTAPWSRFARP